jgi:type II secretory pathway component PulK
MKIKLHQPRDGVAIIVVLALLSLMLIYIAANARTLHHLARDLHLIDQRQTRHWAAQNLQTNSPAVSNLATNPVPRALGRILTLPAAAGD